MVQGHSHSPIMAMSTLVSAVDSPSHSSAATVTTTSRSPSAAPVRFPLPNARDSPLDLLAVFEHSLRSTGLLKEAAELA